MRRGVDGFGLAVAGLSPRERWMSAFAVLALLGGGAYETLQWADAERTRYALAQADLVLAEQSRATQAHDRLGATDRAELEALSSWSEHGATLWMVRLKVEQRLVQAAAMAGLKDTQIKLAEALEGDAASPLLRAEVTGPFHGDRGVVLLLKRLSDGDTAFALDRLEVDTSAAEFKLALSFPVHVDAPLVHP